MTKGIIFNTVIEKVRNRPEITFGELTTRFFEEGVYQIYEHKSIETFTDWNPKEIEKIIIDCKNMNCNSFYFSFPSDEGFDERIEITLAFVKKHCIEINGLLFVSPNIEKIFLSENGKFPMISLDVVDLNQIFKRIKDVIDYDLIRTKTVSIIGLGSGGSRVAVELARCGIHNFVLIDYDELKPVNISRHICGMQDIGRLKIHAVKDMLKNINPNMNVDTVSMDVNEEKEKFEKIAKKSDLLVAASGAPQSYKTINEISVKNKIPCVYAGLWKEAIAGYVMRVIPGKTACFNCAHEVMLRNAPKFDPNPDYYRLPTDDDLELKSEPGLSVDIGFITLLQSRMCINVLQEREIPNILNTDESALPNYVLWLGQTILIGIPQKEETYEDISQDYLLWTNREYKGNGPFSILRADVPKRENCAVCNEGGWLAEIAKEYGIDVEDLSTELSK